MECCPPKGCETSKTKDGETDLQSPLLNRHKLYVFSPEGILLPDRGKHATYATSVFCILRISHFDQTAEVWSRVDVVLISKKYKFKASEMTQVGLVAKPDNLGSVPGT